jgi:serine/threonine protein kinase
VLSVLPRRAGLVNQPTRPVPIPSALDDLVLSCLAKDPAARPQTARELSRRLASIEGANDWTDDRARAWWASHQSAS